MHPAGSAPSATGSIDDAQEVDGGPMSERRGNGDVSGLFRGARLDDAQSSKCGVVTARRDGRFGSIMYGRDLRIWFDEAKRDDNPYLSAWFAVAFENDNLPNILTHHAEWKEAYERLIQIGLYEHGARRALVGKYAWAIPCEAAIQAMLKIGPIVELGAGTGYWAWLLRKRGADVLAFDAEPPPSELNHWHKINDPWIKVERGKAGVASDFADHSLFLCWPPYDDEFAADALKAYLGNRIIYVGENQGGCTAADSFFEALERDFVERETVNLPQFDGIHDYLTIYERR